MATRTLDKTCETCGKAYAAGTTVQKYCRAECRPDYRPPAPPKFCVLCGHSFRSHQHNQKRCRDCIRRLNDEAYERSLASAGWEECADWRLGQLEKRLDAFIAELDRSAEATLNQENLMLKRLRVVEEQLNTLVRSHDCLLTEFSELAQRVLWIDKEKGRAEPESNWFDKFTRRRRN